MLFDSMSNETTVLLDYFFGQLKCGNDVHRILRKSVQITLIFYHTNKTHTLECRKRQPDFSISDYLCPLSSS